MPDRHASFAGDSDAGDDACAESPMRRWQVLLPLPLDGAYDYIAPANWDVAPGSFVAAPLGRRVVPGVVCAAGNTDGIAAARLKPIDSVLHVPRMAESLRRFGDSVAAYYLTPPRGDLRMTISALRA